MGGFYRTVSTRDDAIFHTIERSSDRLLDYNSFLTNKETFCPLWKKILREKASYVKLGI